jgi:TonB family protein
MTRKTLKETPRIAVLIVLLAFPKAWAENGAKAFAFVNARYVITSEDATAHTFVLNFINLSDFVIVIQPNEFIYKGASGRFYIGQVFESEHKDLRGEMQKYSASLLLKSHSFVGLTIVGAFHEQDQIEEMSVRIGAKRFYLQPMQKEAFEQLAAKIGDLNISGSNPVLALNEADISERGLVRSTDGTSEWDRDWQGLITPDGVNPPKIIERPEIAPTADAIRSHTYGRVKLSGIINKNGGIQDLKVLKGLGKGLDQRALEGVKNGWIFLPATKNGEVIDTAISIEVDFPAPEKKK